MDSEGQKLEGTIGPFKEHSNIRLFCEAEGGNVDPKLFLFCFYSLNITFKLTILT